MKVYKNENKAKSWAIELVEDPREFSFRSADVGLVAVDGITGEWNGPYGKRV